MMMIMMSLGNGLNESYFPSTALNDSEKYMYENYSG